ncbi:hypothetical protein JCM15519_38220 [Fundidesulfovibrio butyratiphilus]
MSKLTNDQIILKQILKSKLEESQEGLSESEFFEIYSASEVLKDYDLSYDDVLYGVVGDSLDGGIDSVYTFLNGEMLKEDTEVNAKLKNCKLDLVIIQSKTSPGFNESVIDKFRSSAEDLLDLGNDLDDFSQRYNDDIRQMALIFRKAYQTLAASFPRLNIEFYYITHGVEVHPNVSGKVGKLGSDIQRLFSGCHFDFHFIGARELIEISRRTPSKVRSLDFTESTIQTDKGSYICLVSLGKYFNFICDGGSLARSVFEANVRDYQGSVVVNQGIRATLSNKLSEDFWYLNNGVTIITPKASSAGKTITIEDPQIVNGLQTSHEIYNYFSETGTEPEDNRKILVRIICEKNEDARERIIKATNSQTSIPPASLRSSDEVHRNIEDFLKAHNLYYDRKKNYYKNQGKTISSIIGIPYLAQAMMAIILKKPDSARARPSTLINSNVEYEKIFSQSVPIDTYLKVIKLMKSVELFLKPQSCPIELQRKDITNIKYYVAMVAAIKIVNGSHDIAKGLSAIPNLIIGDTLISESFYVAYNKYIELGGNDQVAKGPTLVASLLASLKNAN